MIYILSFLLGSIFGFFAALFFVFWVRTRRGLVRAVVRLKAKGWNKEAYLLVALDGQIFDNVPKWRASLISVVLDREVQTMEVALPTFNAILSRNWLPTNWTPR